MGGDERGDAPDLGADMSEMQGTEWVQDPLPLDCHPCPDCGACFACGTECDNTCPGYPDFGSFEYGDPNE